MQLMAENKIRISLVSKDVYPLSKVSLFRGMYANENGDARNIMKPVLPLSE